MDVLQMLSCRTRLQCVKIFLILLRSYNFDLKKHLRVISSTEDVASAGELTQLIGGELELVSFTRQVLHLNHEGWNPESVDHIGCGQSEANFLALRKILSWWLGRCSCNNRLIARFWITKLPRPLEAIDVDLMLNR